MKLQKTEKQIFNSIKKASEFHFKKRGASTWTGIIKQALRKLGKRRGYRVYPSHKRKGQRSRREWLYDLCWSIEGKDWRKFKGLKLIAEIEWKKGRDKQHYDSILEEFQKLTVVIATYRLLVMGYNDSGKSKFDKKWLAGFIKECVSIKSGKEFRYLVIALPEKDKENIRSYLIHDGKFSKVE